MPDSDEILPPHDCDTCDLCISNFFSRVQLSNVVDISAVLTTPKLRDAIVKFVRAAMEYVLYDCSITL